MAEEKYIDVFLTALLSDDDLIRTLTGQAVQNREDAFLDGYNLVVQRLNQIPESAQKIIRGSWGDNFESYNLAPGEGSIKGIKCKVTKDQWDRLKDWEFVEFGWFAPREAEVRDPITGQVRKVMTMVMGEGQEYDRKVDGENFSPFLMPRERTLKIASIARQLYDERISRSPERQNHTLEAGN
ncbi:hypothetical protein M1146_01385 [Patescibacteria group bacterium]|nr:hypothetical protein [Patescibacteria group bacterium]